MANEERCPYCGAGYGHTSLIDGTFYICGTNKERDARTKACRMTQKLRAENADLRERCEALERIARWFEREVLSHYTNCSVCEFGVGSAGCQAKLKALGRSDCPRMTLDEAVTAMIERIRKEKGVSDES